MEIIKRKNKLTYRETVYVDGVRFRSPVFEKKTDAKIWKADLLSKREKLKAVGEEFNPKVRFTFAEFSKKWLKTTQHKRTLSTYNNYERIIRLHFSPRFDQMFLDQITPPEVDKLVQALLKSGHNAKGVNTIIQVLKGIFFEADRQELFKKNPLRAYPMLKVIKLSPTFWSDLEIRQFLLATTNHFLYPLFVVALNTGMRRGELIGLCWDRVDFSRNMIEVSRIKDRYGLRSTTKSGNTRHVPMNEIVRATLLKLFQNRSSEFCFTNTQNGPVDYKHLYRVFRVAQKKAKIDREIRFHDLRHCFASHFMMNGGNLYDLQKILGHSRNEMTQIYVHLSPEHLSGVTHILNFGKVNSEKVAHKQPTEIFKVI